MFKDNFIIIVLKIKYSKMVLLKSSLKYILVQSIPSVYVPFSAYLLYLCPSLTQNMFFHEEHHFRLLLPPATTTKTSSSRAVVRCQRSYFLNLKQVIVVRGLVFCLFCLFLSISNRNYDPLYISILFFTSLHRFFYSLSQ